MTEFQTIADDMAFLDDWEDRYKYVIDLGRALPEFPDEDRTEENKVRGCASQVWLVAEENGGRLTFRGDSDAHIVKGLVAVLLTLFSGRTKEEIGALDADAELAKIDLASHLSAQRANGLASMLARIKAYADA
ncbi:MAG: SufE family protein [Pseudomonadota bacterium]